MVHEFDKAYVIKIFLDFNRKAKIVTSMNEDIFTFSLACVDRYEDKMEEVASSIVSFINFKVSVYSHCYAQNKLIKYIEVPSL